jgi:D-alanyl-D-alanine carboxypeptidase (penicillin-binding protein 5/6)
MSELESIDRRRFLQAGGAGIVALLAARAEAAQAPKDKEAPLPAKQAADALDGPPIVSARAWAITDGASGRLLWGAHESAEYAMASTTKVMTAHVVLRLAVETPATLDEMIVVSEQAARTGGSSARIRAGDRIRVRDMLYGLLLPSGNDAAAALAEHFGPRLRERGSDDTPVRAFVGAMNRQAQSLGLAETHYLDPHGIGSNRTSARNLVTLAHAAMQDRRFRRLVQTRRHEAEATNAQGEKRPFVWNNSNQLLGIEGYDGIKTGTTTAARYCLVGSGRRGDDHLLVAVLGATSNDSRYIDTRNLFRWAWQQRQCGSS